LFVATHGDPGATKGGKISDRPKSARCNLGNSAAVV
jgi:hypothetical protein